MADPSNISDKLYRVLECEHFSDAYAQRPVDPAVTWIAAGIFGPVGAYLSTESVIVALCVATLAAIGYILGWHRWNPIAKYFYRIELGPGRRLTLESVSYRLPLDVKDIQAIRRPFWTSRYSYHAHLLDGSKALLLLNPEHTPEMWAWLRRYQPDIELP